MNDPINTRLEPAPPTSAQLRAMAQEAEALWFLRRKEDREELERRLTSLIQRLNRAAAGKLAEELAQSRSMKRVGSSSR